MNRIWLNWNRTLRHWNQAQVVHCNILSTAPVVQWTDYLVSIRTEYRHNALCHNHPDWPAPINYDVGWVSPGCYPVQPFLLSRYQETRTSFLFCSVKARLSRDLIENAVKWWKSELQSKNGSLRRLEEMETDIGKCFSIQVVVFKAFKILCCTQIDSKPSIAKFLKNFCWLVYFIPKESSLSKTVPWIWYTFLG